MRKYLNKKTIPLFLFMVIISVLFLLFGLFVPVRLTIEDVPNPFYADIRLSSSNVSVEYVSLFGLHFPAKDVYGTQLVNGDVSIWSRGLSYQHHYDIVFPTETKVSYHGDGVYVGQTVDKSDFSVIAVYEDGEREVEWFEVSQDVIPLASDVTLPVQLMYSVMDIKLKTIQPAKVQAVYDATCRMGDDFDKTKMQVSLLYTDDTEYRILDFLIPDVPKYVTDDMVVNVVTDYGNASCHIVPENAAKLSVSYTEPVYVGDTLDKQFVELKVGDNLIDPSEFEIDDVGVIKTRANVLVSSKYGNVTLTIEPFTVKSCKLGLSEGLVSGSVPIVDSVTLVFSNDTIRDVNVDECQFLNTAKPVESGNVDLWFIYKDLYLYGKVFVVPEQIASLRVLDDTVEHGAMYELTDKQIQNIAIVCQRLASDDLSWIGYEVSLMANRYELYGSDSNIWDYIVNSGYWGSDITEYVVGRKADDMVVSMVCDVLCNGYRRLPFYVDARCMFVSDGILQNGDYIQSGSSGSILKFYTVASLDSNWVYGATESAYQVITGDVFHVNNVLQSADTFMSDETLIIGSNDTNSNINTDDIVVN